MAKAGDKPKNWVEKEKEQEVIGWVDPNPDPYNFGKTIQKLIKNGFDAFKEDGVLIVESSQKNYKEIEEVINSCNFLGSWGVRSYKYKPKKEIIKEEEAE